ncbi:uncharacterized protein LY79DRAFT_563276, partial [Colletotrichum navitas]
MPGAPLPAACPSPLAPKPGHGDQVRSGSPRRGPLGALCSGLGHALSIPLRASPCFGTPFMMCDMSLRSGRDSPKKRIRNPSTSSSRPCIWSGDCAAFGAVPSFSRHTVQSLLLREVSHPWSDHRRLERGGGGGLVTRTASIAYRALKKMKI